MVCYSRLEHYKAYLCVCVCVCVCVCRMHLESYTPLEDKLDGEDPEKERDLPFIVGSLVF